MVLSNTQTKKLGDRLRSGNINDNDLVMLDAFRQTFREVDEKAYTIIQQALPSPTDLTITKRKRKTQQSIVDKLVRQANLRLPQMQDIAGCRIVLQSGINQANNLNDILLTAFENQHWKIKSKERLTDGYRAIHIIAKLDKKFYEIQLRTYAQDIWANLVESLSDKSNTLKYGGSDDEKELIMQLKELSESFYLIDKNAHKVSIEQYQHQIEEAIRHVLSH